MSAFLCLLVAAAQASPPLTLEAALLEAREANARLPVVAMDVKAGEERLRSARGRLLPMLGVQSDLQMAPPGFAYNPTAAFVGEERLQLSATESLYEGGALRAAIAASEAQVRAARAGYRVSEKEVDLDVRTRFSEVLRDEEDVRFRTEGVERLRSYLLTIRERQAAGEGLQLDVLKTETRLASEEAAAEDAARFLREAEMELADLLGRDPAAPLSVVPLPEPAPPGALAEGAWQDVPDLLQVTAQVAVAEANAEAALAGRRPHLSLSADAGLLGPGFSTGLPAGGFAQRLRDDLGASLTLSLSLPLFDFGVYQGEIGRVRARAEQARRQVVVLHREARLRFTRSYEDLLHWYRETELRKNALPLARDAYLAAESLYRGGTGTALDVLDSFGALIGASQAYAEAVFSYRVAQATALRWGTP